MSTTTAQPVRDIAGKVIVPTRCLLAAYVKQTGDGPLEFVIGCESGTASETQAALRLAARELGERVK